MKIENLRQLFETELRYTYDCEQKLVKKGLPTMISNATSPELRSALEEHLEETRSHITRLDRVFSIVGSEAKTEDNDVLDEITSSAKDMIDDIKVDSVRDAAIIVGGNKVEHYEMAIYGSLAAFARQLGFTEAASLLEETLEEEKTADAKLTQIAESLVNTQASQQRRVA